jgi:hypothetical protein
LAILVDIVWNSEEICLDSCEVRLVSKV